MKTNESQRYEERGSATILQFPRGGRTALANTRSDIEVHSFLPMMALGDAWYHDAAMQDEKSGKH